MRIRTIKPEWVSDSRMTKTSWAARALSVFLITQTDDDGNGEWDPETIGSRLQTRNPNAQAEVEQAMQELTPWFAVLYEASGQTYYHLVNFLKHQRIDKPQKPKYPTFTTNAAIIPRMFPDRSQTVLGPFLDRSCLIGREGIGKDPRGRDKVNVSAIPGAFHDAQALAGKLISSAFSPVAETQTCPVDSEASNPKGEDPRIREAFEYWRKVMGKRSNTILDANRRRRIRDRLKEGYTLDDIKRAIDGCSQDAWSMGANDRSRQNNDIELICRSATKLEGFRDALDAPSGPVKPWAMPHGMKEWADRVLTKELFPEANGGDSIFWDATKKGWYHFTKEPLPLGTFEKLELAHEEICARFEAYLAELNKPKGSAWQQN